MSHLFYSVKRPLTNGFRPGEQHRADEFAGCDLDWLIQSGAVEGIGTHVPGMPMMVAPPESNDPNVLKSEIIRLQQQNHMLSTGQAAAAQFHSPPAQERTKLPSPERMEDARRLQAAEQAAAMQMQAETIQPVRRNPGQAEMQPVPVQRPPLFPDRPGAVSIDLTGVLKRIDETRDAIIDEIRRYATDGQEEAGKRSLSSSDADQLEMECQQLRESLTAAQNAAADYKRQLDELKSQPQTQPQTQQESTPQNDPPPAPTRRKGPEKPIK